MHTGQVISSESTKHWARICGTNYIILKASGKGQTNIDNQRWTIIARLLGPGPPGIKFMSLKLEKN
jgi:hypothetical protein